MFFLRGRLAFIGVLVLCLFIFYPELTIGGQEKECPHQKKVIKPKGTDISELPFSPAIKIGDWLFLSGTIGNDPATGKLAEGIEAQTRQALENLGALLKEAGMSYENVVKATVYVTDINDYDALNKVYKEYYPSERPARAVVEVSELVRGAKVEISMIAMKCSCPTEKKEHEKE